MAIALAIDDEKKRKDNRTLHSRSVYSAKTATMMAPKLTAPGTTRPLAELAKLIGEVAAAAAVELTPMVPKVVPAAAAAAVVAPAGTGEGAPAARPALGVAPAVAVVNCTWGTVTTVVIVLSTLDAGMV